MINQQTKYLDKYMIKKALKKNNDEKWIIDVLFKKNKDQIFRKKVT